jgi:hypothetical protein
MAALLPLAAAVFFLLLPAAAARRALPRPSPAAPLAPGLFVIGDSTADVGTNNYLGTLARADREPYGRDFDTHRPPGRFSNGRIPVDYIGAGSWPSNLLLFLAYTFWLFPSTSSCSGEAGAPLRAAVPGTEHARGRRRLWWTRQHFWDGPGRQLRFRGGRHYLQQWLWPVFFILQKNVSVQSLNQMH